MIETRVIVMGEKILFQNYLYFYVSYTMEQELKQYHIKHGGTWMIMSTWKNALYTCYYYIIPVYFFYCLIFVPLRSSSNFM